MSSIISLVVRSLYSLIAVFFFVITVQPVIAADKYDTAITDFQNYVDHSGRDWQLENKFTSALHTLPDNDPALKERILAIKDANGNNLVHILLKNGHAWGLPFEQFSKLFKICGIDIFTAKNNQQLTPLQASTDKLSALFASRGGHYDHAESELLQAELKPLVRAMVPGFIQSYKSFREELRQETANQDRRRFHHTSSNGRSYDTINHDLKNAAIGLGISTRLFGVSSLRGIALEQIDSPEFYREMHATPEGARVLRDYRVAGQTLYNYFSDREEAGEHYHVRRNVTTELLPIYYYEGVPVPSSRDVDIKPRTDPGHPSEAFFRAYKNSQGQNMAFLAAIIDHYDLLQSMNNQGVGVAGMLRQKDYSGQDALGIINNIEHFAERLFDIDPTLLTTPYFKDGTTPLMVLALFHPERYLVDTPANNYSDARDGIGIRTKLTKKGVRFDQRDAAGNTAESIAQARQRQIEQDQANIIVEEDGYRNTLDTSREFISTFINNILNKQPLDGELWHTMMHHPYSLMLDAGSFIDRGIELILNRENSPVRSSFLQQNQEGREQANQLWDSFLATCDDLVRKERQVRDDDYSFEEPMIARPVRVLDIIAGRNMRSDQTHATFEIMQTLQSNILAAGGTFGMNFKRTANEDEARIMIESLGGFGASALHSKEQSFFETLDQAIKGIGEENFEDISDFIASHDNSFTRKVTDKDNMRETIMHHIVNPFKLRVADEVAGEIIQRLFKADSKLTIEQRVKLEDHQTNCAVMALASIFNQHGGINFDEIDRVLASRPLMRDKSASYYKSSEQRYEDLMEMVGRSHVGGYGDYMGGIPMPHSGEGYRSGDDNGSDFGEEY